MTWTSKILFLRSDLQICWKLSAKLSLQGLFFQARHPRPSCHNIYIFLILPNNTRFGNVTVDSLVTSINRQFERGVAAHNSRISKWGEKPYSRNYKWEKPDHQNYEKLLIVRSSKFMIGGDSIICK